MSRRIFLALALALAAGTGAAAEPAKRIANVEASAEWRFEVEPE